VETYPILIGTAGHIDHGKTALVHVLTGIDTDRLKVEKERGITTELGFAHLDLGNRRFGVIDVPGHERFIKAMVSGAAGLDLVCLVIAADEGVMPQTREHLDICSLLGVRRGVIALTKSDLVDKEWIALVTEEIAGVLNGTFLDGANIVPVSSKTGAGLDDLRAELVRLTDDLPARAADGTFRLPVDRVFSIRGFGTVVTGTILGGTLNVGDSLVVHPSGRTAKVRGLEIHGETANSARAGMRCAINVTGLDRADVRRGDFLAHEGKVTPSHLLDARFRYLATSKQPLGRRNRVLLHHGTTQVMGSLILVDKDQLQPGEDALVQLRLDIATPLAALPGERFIARGFVLQAHYGTTLGGGEILRVQAPKARRSSVEARESLERIAVAEHDERVALEIRGAKVRGLTTDELLQRLGLARHTLQETLTRLIEARDITAAGEGQHAFYCHAETVAKLEQAALDVLNAFHSSNPNKDGMSREELRSRLSRSLTVRLYDRILEGLVEREAIAVGGMLVSKATRRPRPTAGESPIDKKLSSAFGEWGLAPKRPKEIPGALGISDRDSRDGLERLLGASMLTKVKSDLYVDTPAIDDLRRRLIEHLDAHNQITPAEWKQLTGTSRKYSIPLAEFFDGEKLTLRIGDVRKRR